MDLHKNLAYSTVASAPSAGGTQLAIQTGDNAAFPTPPFNCTVWAASAIPTTASATMIRVTTVAANLFTFVRTAEGVADRTIAVGDQIANTITVSAFTDIEVPTKYLMGLTWR